MHFIAVILLDYKTKWALDRALNDSMYQQVEIFTEGETVYLSVPHAWSLQQVTSKFHQYYVDPLVIDTVLDFDPLQMKRSGKQSIIKHIPYQ